MKPVIFERSVEIPASAGELFHFHENPRNISKIAPASLKIEAVDCEETARPGGIFRLRARQFGLPIRWTGKWEAVEQPRLLLDVALDSPFTVWRHSHIFENTPGGCRMTDRVEFLLKGGWAGGLVSRWAVPLFFLGMFRARHAATRRFFSKSSPESRSFSGA